MTMINDEHNFLTFFVEINSASNASTRQTAALNNSSLSGIAHDFASNMFIFPSSSQIFFARDESPSPPGRPKIEGEENSSVVIGSVVNTIAFREEPDNESANFLVTRYLSEQMKVKRTMEKNTILAQIWARNLAIVLPLGEWRPAQDYYEFCKYKIRATE